MRSDLDGLRARFLVVDDEPVIAEMIAIVLRGEGAQVFTAHDAATAMSHARRHRPDAAIVDPRVPDAGGCRLLQLLRTVVHDLPILVLDPVGVEQDCGPYVGAADDCVTMPFAVEELLLRLRLLLRTRQDQVDGAEATTIVVGDLRLDEKSRAVTRGSRRVELSYNEFELLRYLMRHAGRSVTQRQILARVWPYDYAGHVDTVRRCMNRLRAKVDDGASVPMIRTLARHSYLLMPLT
ncbi:response regulator transcription factor [Mycolicibacterium sp. CBM1]